MIIKNSNRNDEALFAAAYVVGFEVLSRMTGGVGFSYEFAKYCVIVFMTIGMFYRGFQRKSWPYLLFVLFLMPSLLVSAIYVDFNTKFGNVVGFNLSGPFCLGVSALYCFDRKVSQAKFNNILLACLMPIIAMTVYLYLFTPDIRDVLTGTQSNFEASGGFGPNQVATILGLGMFIVFTRLFLIKNKIKNILDVSLLGFFGFRAFVTFSRGGVIVASICALIFLFFYFHKSDRNERSSLITKLMVIGGVCIITWGFTSFMTNGLIDKRYANQDALGRVKKDISTGRAELIESELHAFTKNPFIGIGAGRTKEYRLALNGHDSATHNEVSRMLSEHGIFGVLNLLILIFVPTIKWFSNHRNLFIIALIVFWFLTINHSSMRISASAFIYGIALLYITNEPEEDTLIHRE